MLAESAVYSTSPWKHEQPFSNYGLDVSALEAEIEMVRRGTDNLKCKENRSNTTLSRSPSVASSDSDEPFLDMDGDDTFLSSNVDDEYLGNTLLDMMDVPDCSEIGGFDWKDADLESHVSGFFQDLSTENSSDLDVSVTSSPCAKRKRTCEANRVDKCNKQWKRMSSTEQLLAIENLTRIISCEMGLREQLEVIRIINPNATVSPIDTEFVIELDKLTDEKLQRVQDYVNNPIHHLHSNGNTSSTTSPQRLKKGYRSSKASCSSSSSSSSSCCGDSEGDCSPQKKLTKKQKAQLKAQQQKEARQRQRKEYRQMQKEKKSGLFRKEEVLALASCGADDGSDEDIDILE